MIVDEVLPDIPRWLTAAAEWGACLVYVALVVRRPSTVPQAVLLLGVLLGGGGVLWGVQELAGRLPIAFWTLGMFLAVVLMWALLRCTLPGGAAGAAYLAARAFVLAELIASLHWQLRTFVASTGAADLPGPVLDIGLVAVVHGGGFTIAYLAESRHLARGEELRVRSSELVVAGGIAIGTFLVSNLSFSGIATPFSARPGAELFAIRTLVDLCGYVALLAQQQQRREQGARAESAAVHALLRSQHEQYLQSKRALEEVDRKVHDMRHWIEMIRAEPDANRRSGLLDDLEQRVMEEARQRRTGSAVLDTILAAKGAACAAHRIQLSVVADGRLLDVMHVIDATSLIGNALDNAIEAAQRVPEVEQRRITFALFAQNAFVMLRIENSYDGRMLLSDGRPTTRKEDPLRHGFGLTSIERTAEQYGGSATYSASQRWFTLRVLIPRPESEHG